MATEIIMDSYLTAYLQAVCECETRLAELDGRAFTYVEFVFL